MMKRSDWRDQVWDRLEGSWDLIIIGGGITGAGILREAARAGLQALLIEAHDFGSGTSSRSSKMVHGGFRYLRDAKFRLTLESVRERELLLRQGKGLISPMSFLLANHRGDRIPSWLLGLGLVIYDLFGLQWGRRHYGPETMRDLCPQLGSPQMIGGYRYFDAQVDDARLVLRVIKEAIEDGGAALNYTRGERLLRNRSGKVCGVQIRSLVPGSMDRHAEVFAPVVVNAAGAWSDELRAQVGRLPQLRKLRGGHLLFPWSRVPLSRAMSFMHPGDGRPVFIFPWEGVTLYGTTDVDHRSPLETDVAISDSEVEYLMRGLDSVFPRLELTREDIQATFAGVRPVVNTGKKNPSKESREHVLWKEDGLLTVTGGKLTTFRVMAHDALRSVRGRIRDRLPGRMILTRRLRVFDEVERVAELASHLEPTLALRLFGRYGSEAAQLVDAAGPGELERMGDTPTVWAELRWTARAEGVVHLEDLLLRRVRVGLTLPEGGLAYMARIRSIVQDELGWSDTDWEAEASRYRQLWTSFHGLNCTSKQQAPSQRPQQPPRNIAPASLP